MLAIGLMGGSSNVSQRGDRSRPPGRGWRLLGVIRLLNLWKVSVRRGVPGHRLFRVFPLKRSTGTGDRGMSSTTDGCVEVAFVTED